MASSFSDIPSSATYQSIKHASGHKQPRRTTIGRAASISSFASQSTQSSSSSTSISTTAAHDAEMGRLSPTLYDIDVMRYTWERVCERRYRKDILSVSSAHAFGIVFYKTLFELDPSLKPIFGKNVIHQARVLAGIMSYLTRSPSIKGESGSLRDLNSLNRSFKYSFSSASVPDHHVADDDHYHNASSCTDHGTACINTANNTNAYVDLIEHHASLVKSQKNTPAQATATTTAPPSVPIVVPVKEKQFSDEVCPFHQQEQEEKYQQQLLLQQQQQQEEERQRTFMQQEVQRKMEQQHHEENQWFAYKLREVGIQHIEEYNMEPDHLDALGPALIAALKSRLQEEFSPQIEHAWNKVCKFTFYHMKTGMEAHIAYHKRARRLSSGSYCSIEAGETNGACTIQ